MEKNDNDDEKKGWNERKKENKRERKTTTPNWSEREKEKKRVMEETGRWVGHQTNE